MSAAPLDSCANTANFRIRPAGERPVGAVRNIGIQPTDPLGWAFAFAELGTLVPRLLVRNHRSVESDVGTGAANVSLTSYGKRISTVWQTIETIGAGTVKPRRLILWLDDRDAYLDPPATLKRLQARGLEIRHCRDYGPHKKYFPYLNEILPDEPARTLVTADDDGAITTVTGKNARPAWIGLYPSTFCTKSTM